MSNIKLDDTSPLGIFLVKSGSNGETLLFRYPYSLEDKNKSNESKPKSKYAHIIKEDTAEDDSTVKSTNMPPYSELSSPVTNVSFNTNNNNESFALVLGITDEAFANLFAVTPKLCGEKFELKVNDLRFVGHPMLLSSENLDNDLLTFNVVFALRANAGHDVVNCYHDLSKRITIGLCFEEKRCGFLSAEAKQMIHTHDEITNSIEEGHSLESPYKLILEKSRLAKDFKKIFDELFSKGTVHIRLNRWIEISFCLPQKVHSLLLKDHVNTPAISTENINNCLNSLRPYHGIILLVDVQELLESLPKDASPAFVRVIKMTSPTKNLIELSADADLTLSQVFNIISQLVYWGKATVIYPLCENNVYIIHPLAPTHVGCALIEKFAEKFSGSDSLLNYLSEFSLGISLSQWKNPLHNQEQQKQQIQMISWLLQHRLLLQLHTYVYFMPSSKSIPYLTRRVSYESDRPQSSIAEGDSLQEFSVASSYQSDDSFTNQLNTFGSLYPIKSNSDQLLSPKLNSFNEISILSEAGLNGSEIDSIMKIPASKNFDDLKLFVKLCPYFDGKHHLEHIMYYENVRRSVLLSLLDKFRDVLFTCQYEDASVSQLCPYEKTI